MTIHILPIKTRGFAPHTPDIDENNENGGCHSSKTSVRQKHRFRHPDKRTSCWCMLEGDKLLSVQFFQAFQGLLAESSWSWLAGKSLQGGVLGTFWKPPSQNPF